MLAVHVSHDGLNKVAVCFSVASCNTAKVQNSNVSQTPVNRVIKSENSAPDMVDSNPNVTIRLPPCRHF